MIAKSITVICKPMTPSGAAHPHAEKGNAMDRCEIPRCKREAETLYLGRNICSTHMEKSPEELRSELKIANVPEEDPAADATSNGSPTSTTAPEEEPMKTTKNKQAKTPKDKAPVAAKRSVAAKGDLMTFAMRLTPADSARIHEAAGPGKASKFVLDAALKAAEKALA